MSARFVISAHPEWEESGRVAVRDTKEDYYLTWIEYKDEKERKAALKEAKKMVERAKHMAQVRDATRTGIVIWLPPVPVSPQLLEKAYSAICTWHGIYNCKVDQGAITADDLPRSEAGRSSLQAYVEGLNDALITK